MNVDERINNLVRIAELHQQSLDKLAGGYIDGTQIGDKELAKKIRGDVLQEIKKQKRPGGLLSN